LRYLRMVISESLNCFDGTTVGMTTVLSFALS